ncbi:HAD family phosphatase [Labilibaculum sp. K2S]|uniref:HAD family hydrolase n=1 Tax=Labilibaculum sp. K2S TaxID=3056386 RepID=UPI0025A45FA8|nr:HAD family phosphatase [Labilibaculum sp. K2S]MDM8161161.1 HAD family phosphatase [Labilibaculum sp. K2S]
MKIKGVIFDFNGTLFWDTALHNKAWDIFLERHNLKLSDKEKNEKIHGKNNRDILNGLFQRQLLKEDINKFGKEKEKIYQELCLQTNMQLAPGAIDFFNYLKGKNIPFVIATASEIDNVDFYFDHLKLDSFFDRTEVIFNNGKMKSKPDPQIFNKAMNVMGLSGNETLVFEDSISGIKSAENAKVAKIIIVNSNNDDYSDWSYQQIRNFAEVDKRLFE